MTVKFHLIPNDLGALDRKASTQLCLIAALFMLILTPAFADGAIGELYHFAEDVRNVAWETAPLPQDFVLSEEDTDRAVTFMELDQELGEYVFSQTERPQEKSDTPCSQVSDSDASKKALEEKI